jgi:hypothetical protein
MVKINQSKIIKKIIDSFIQKSCVNIKNSEERKSPNVKKNLVVSSFRIMKDRIGSSDDSIDDQESVMNPV